MTNKKQIKNYFCRSICVFALFKATFIFVLVSTFIMGCKPSSELQIQSSLFVEDAKCKQIEAAALKISSKSDFDTFISECQNKSVAEALNAHKAIDWRSSFIYLTRNYALVEIKKYRQMKVQIAILKNECGIGIYLIKGNSNIPLKVTEKAGELKKSSADDSSGSKKSAVNEKDK
jgi:hypothetical protein